MMRKKRSSIVFIGGALFSCIAIKAYAHGYSEYPQARQSICYEQGGVWSGNPPNAACANAKNISGSYPFVQRNEYAKNITDFNNLSAVRAAIPDGTLCYANDPQKRGMGAPHIAWTRTEMHTGTFEYVFNATAPHNPSFWEFYLTKPNADLSKSLAWGDLDLIQETGNVPVESGKYRINLTIPSDRSGDAILFVRWQRDDAAGEGFYNCSDITIKNGNTPTPEPTPDLHRGSSFIPSELEYPEVGDVVRYDILNKDGTVARSFDISVDLNNVTDWDRLLASEINGWHAEFKNGAVFIGDWHEEMQHYMYFQHDQSRNFFNSKDSRASGLMTVSHGGNDNVNPLAGQIFELSQSDNIINSGGKVVIVTEENAILTQTQGTPVQIQNNGSSSIIIDTQSITQNETLIFSASATNSHRTGSFTFEVVIDDGSVIPPPNPEPDPYIGNAWNSSMTYVGGEIVTYAGKEWKAQWWTQGGDDPETTYSKDIWGVWRPLN